VHGGGSQGKVLKGENVARNTLLEETQGWLKKGTQVRRKVLRGGREQDSGEKNPERCHVKHNNNR